MASRAARLLLLMLGVAAVAAQTSVQSCIPLGTPVFNDCKAELDFLNKPENYPLTSTTPPDDAKIKSVVSKFPPGLPSPACCAAAEKFHTSGCSCEAQLAEALKSAGIQTEPAGLAGVSNLAATACKYQVKKC